jgi:hypothetical protein
MSAALQIANRAWIYIGLPGVRDTHATCASFAYADLPPIEVPLHGSFDWLRGDAMVDDSPLTDEDARMYGIERVATRDGLQVIGALDLPLPSAFETFMSSPGLQSLVGSGVTGTIWDLAAHLGTTTEGGHLVHFLCDQQWVLHWLLYVGDAGSEAVVCTAEPIGHERNPRAGGERNMLDLRRPDCAVVAESFEEFVYRFLIENQLWYALNDSAWQMDGLDGPIKLTDVQQRYVDHYQRLTASDPER